MMQRKEAGFFKSKCELLTRRKGEVRFVFKLKQVFESRIISRMNVFFDCKRMYAVKHVHTLNPKAKKGETLH